MRFIDKLLPSEFQDNCGSLADSEELRTTLVTLKWQGTSDSASKVIPLPVPYELPPIPYSSEGHYLFPIHFCLFFVACIWLLLSSWQMFPGLGTGAIARRMFTARFGQGPYSFILLRTSITYFICLFTISPEFNHKGLYLSVNIVKAKGKRFILFFHF